MDKFFKKQYIPGYTGHIPHKINSFGLTVGQINKQLVLNDVPTEEGIVKRNYYSDPPIPDKKTDNLKFSNLSRYAVNWISGPTEKVFPQHIPGKIKRV